MSPWCETPRRYRLILLSSVTAQWDVAESMDQAKRDTVGESVWLLGEQEGLLAALLPEER